MNEKRAIINNLGLLSAPIQTDVNNSNHLLHADNKERLNLCCRAV